MKKEITVPSVGESVTEAELTEWFKADGDFVRKDEPLFVIETDKVTLEVMAEADGILTITVQAGETVAIGAVVGILETDAEAPEAGETPEAEVAGVSVQEAETAADSQPEQDALPPVGEKTPEPAPLQTRPAERPSADEEKPQASRKVSAEEAVAPILSPAVRRLVAQKGLDLTRITATGPGGRLTKGDVMLYLEQAPTTTTGDRILPEITEGEEGVTRKPMSPIRRRIAARLLEARQNTAMLTTFNEIDMSRAMALRAAYKEAFQKKHGVSLGFMSFFIKASVAALKEFPAINAFIEGAHIVYHDFYHIGVAVGSERGLVVPVIRHADRMGFAGLEKAIVDFVAQIRENRIGLSELEGGTFTITNGGVFGSLLSTPILNTPQSGILGMHKIEKRPVVVDDEIVIRPMMYVALSYDHRIVDGREAVTFLKRIKECVENPERMMMEI